MKKWLWILVLIILVFLLCCQKQNKEETTLIKQKQEKEEIVPVSQEVKNMLLSAMDRLKEGKLAEGAGSLLEAVLLTKPNEYMPEGFEDKIIEAKSHFQEGAVKKGVESVSKALELINPEEEKQIDVEDVQMEEEPAPIAEIVKNKILSAIEQFKEGNSSEGVVLVLEALQLFSPQ